MSSDRIKRRIERLLYQIEDSADQRDCPQVSQLADDVLVLAPDNADALG